MRFFESHTFEQVQTNQVSHDQLVQTKIRTSYFDAKNRQIHANISKKMIIFSIEIQCF
jgi:hypothetical protein